MERPIGLGFACKMWSSKGKGFIKSEEGIWWFDYKKAIKKAVQYAVENHVSVFVERGDMIWHVLPDGIVRVIEY